MENQFITSGLDEPVDYANGGQWQDTIRLLRLIRSDYQGIRRQLEQVSNTLVERESLINQRLQYTLQKSRGYQTLRLLRYASGSPVCQIGMTLLGDLAQNIILPKSIRLEVRCFGKFEILSAWKQVERWQSVKAKTVLQYLMTRPRQPLVKEVLMEVLWPDYDPRAASNNLKAAIHYLRHTLDDLFEIKKSFSCVVFEQGSYMINPEIDLWVDVDEFERHWALGRLFEKEDKFSEAIEEYEKAEALYRGDYLEEEPYEEWTLLRRESLMDTYLLILSKIADHSLNSGDYDSCITYSQKTLAKDACREDAYRRLMCCHSRLGQRNRALRWYELCQRITKTELNSIPDSETSALYHRLLRNEPI